jgi:hypothetical protein
MRKTWGGEGLLECIHTKAEPMPPRFIRKLNCCLSNLPTCTGVQWNLVKNTHSLCVSCFPSSSSSSSSFTFTHHVHLTTHKRVGVKHEQAFTDSSRRQPVPFPRH